MTTLDDDKWAPADGFYRVYTTRTHIYSRSSNLTWPPATSMYALFFPSTFFIYVTHSTSIYTCGKRRRRPRRRPLWHTFGYYTRMYTHKRALHIISIGTSRNREWSPDGARCSCAAALFNIFVENRNLSHVKKAETHR